MKTKKIKISVVLLTLLFSPLFIWAVPDFVGNCFSSNAPENFSLFWNQVTGSNTDWGAIEMSRGNFQWSRTQSQFHYAKEKGFPYMFRCLVWGSAPPQWMQGVPSSEQRDEVIEWFQGLASQITPDIINVVNEPLHVPPFFKSALGGEGETGWDWVITSFELARHYFPGSKLLINEYYIVNDPATLERYLDIIQLLQERELIDGIGIQCNYFSVDNLSPELLQTSLDCLASTGLPVYVTELSISGNDAAQLERYRRIFPVLYNHPAVKGITIWGYIDRLVWQSDIFLVYDSAIEAARRPAMDWLVSTGLPWLKDPCCDTSTLSLSPEMSRVNPESPFTVSLELENPGRTMSRFTIEISYESSHIIIDPLPVPEGISWELENFQINADSSRERIIMVRGQAITEEDLIPEGTLLNLYFTSKSYYGFSNINIQKAEIYDNHGLLHKVKTNSAIVSVKHYSCALPGDINGDRTVDIIDALLVAQAYVGIEVDIDSLECFDVNCDGELSIVDALLIARYYVGLISSLACSG